MNDQEIILTLARLRYADEQAVRMYDLAFPQFTEEPVSQQMQTYRDDHQRHVERIDQLLGRYGNRAPEVPHEFMAFVQEHLRMVDQAVEADGAVRYLLLAELGVMAEYERALELELGGEFTSAISEFHAEEQHHVDYLEQRTPVLAGAAAQRLGGTTASPPHAVPDMGPGTGGSLGGAVSGIAPKAPKDRGARGCKLPEDTEPEGK